MLMLVLLMAHSTEELDPYSSARVWHFCRHNDGPYPGGALVTLRPWVQPHPSDGILRTLPTHSAAHRPQDCFHTISFWPEISIPWKHRLAVGPCVQQNKMGLILCN